MPNGSRKDRNYDLWGWPLFVISALFFVASSIRNGDMIGLLRGIFFLLASVAFLACYIGVARAEPIPQERHDSPGESID